MTNHSDLVNVKAELDRLTTEFFCAVSFEEGATPNYENIYELFIEPGLLVKNTGSTPEINTVRQFIEPRQVAVRDGELTRFTRSSCAKRQRFSATLRIDSTRTQSRAPSKAYRLLRAAWYLPSSSKLQLVGR